MLLAGKTALVTGAAHGQGRAHALRLAAAGADVIMLDVCETAAQVGYEFGTWAELQETLAGVEAFDRRGHIAKVDVRDRAGLAALRDETAADFPELDIIVANAGISSYARLLEVSPDAWDETVDTNLTGVFNVLQAFVPRIISTGRGGSIIITSSAAGTKSFPFCGPYVAAKHGLQGLAKAYAQELGPHSIRVNTINPASIRSPMGTDASLVNITSGDPEASAWFGQSYAPVLPLPEGGLIDADHVSDTVIFLASDHSKYITGGVFPVDAGVTVR